MNPFDLQSPLTVLRLVAFALATLLTAILVTGAFRTLWRDWQTDLPASEDGLDPLDDTLDTAERMMDALAGWASIVTVALFLGEAVLCHALPHWFDWWKPNPTRPWVSGLVNGASNLLVFVVNLGNAFDYLRSVYRKRRTASRTPGSLPTPPTP